MLFVSAVEEPLLVRVGPDRYSLTAQPGTPEDPGAPPMCITNVDHDAESLWRENAVGSIVQELDGVVDVEGIYVHLCPQSCSQDPRILYIDK